MTTDIDIDVKVQIFSEVVKSLASRGRLNAATKDELRAAFEAARASRLTPQQAYAETRANLLQAAEYQLAPSLAKAPSAAKPSIQPTRPGRQDGSGLQTPDTSRRPNEDRETYYRRIKRQLMKAQQRATPVGQARSLDVTTADSYLESGEKREARYATAKAALLANAEVKAHETQRIAKTRQSSTYAQTADLDRLARNLMKGRGQSINPKTADFRENYRQALKEVAG